MYASERVFPDQGRKGRARITAARIEAQFRSLLAERPFQQISVADIADGCGVARSTFYRLYADPVEVLWAIALPILDEAVGHALKGSSSGFGAAFGRLWSVPGLVAGLDHPKANARVRAKLGTLFQERLRQHGCGRSSETCALVMVAACLTVLAQGHGPGGPAEAELAELMSLIYIAAYLTPGALQSIAREQARRGLNGGFPPAVSVEESLASDDYIVSMIDGRPYRSLTRHIARYGMTPADYRRCFGLDDDYPMVAASYSQRRRALAISTGFARAGRDKAARQPPEPAFARCCRPATGLPQKELRHQFYGCDSLCSRCLACRKNQTYIADIERKNVLLNWMGPADAQLDPSSSRVWFFQR